MEIFFKPSFIKDFKRLPKEIKPEVKKICFEIIPKVKI
jgi:mRNA-degrading endonuclease RelE of RelBE toxin-antitoxin system